jgi:hypothetical protein
MAESVIKKPDNDWIIAGNLTHNTAVHVPLTAKEIWCSPTYDATLIYPLSIVTKLVDSSLANPMYFRSGQFLTGSTSGYISGGVTIKITKTSIDYEVLIEQLFVNNVDVTNSGRLSGGCYYR